MRSADFSLIADALEITPAALLGNVTNYDKLQDNFLGVAEQPAQYTKSRLAKLKTRLEGLSEKQQEAILDQLEQAIDSLAHPRSGTN